MPYYAIENIIKYYKYMVYYGLLIFNYNQLHSTGLIWLYMVYNKYQEDSTSTYKYYQVLNNTQHISTLLNNTPREPIVTICKLL